MSDIQTKPPPRCVFCGNGIRGKPIEWFWCDECQSNSCDHEEDGACNMAAHAGCNDIWNELTHGNSDTFERGEIVSELRAWALECGGIGTALGELADLADALRAEKDGELGALPDGASDVFRAAANALFDDYIEGLALEDEDAP